MNYEEPVSLFDKYGDRKYLNETERKLFYSFCNLQNEEKALYLLMIFYTGARPSEVLGLRIRHLDFLDNNVILRSLKKRGKTMYRQIPLPNPYVERLRIFLQNVLSKPDNIIWQFSYRTACRNVKKVMTLCEITGVKACARGLRHSFAVEAVLENIPLTTLKKWMGHSSIRTTSIYLNVIGEEERKLAMRMWKYG